MSAVEQLAIVQKYEVFLNYFYPIAQNIPRKHGVAKLMLLDALLSQPALFIKAGKTGHISKLYEADAGLAQLRYWLRFCSHEDRRIITMRQHQTAEVMVSEVGRLLGSWIAGKKLANQEGDNGQRRDPRRELERIR